MSKRVIEPTPREEILRAYPIEDAEAPGWYFRIEETSNSVWKVEGRDAYGRAVSRQGPDEAALLKECVAEAARIGGLA